jgi:hypothetical protein
MIAAQLDLGKSLIFEIPNILTEAECHQWKRSPNKNNEWSQS